MPGDGTSESVRAESQRLLVQFIDRELELLETLIALTRIEMAHGNGEHAMQSVHHVRHGFGIVHKFIERLPEQDRSRVAASLERLETEAAGFGVESSQRDTNE